MGVRTALLDQPGAVEEGTGVVVVLLDAGRHREDVGVEDDVLGREADPVDQQPVGAFADVGLALGGFGLALLVERHDHDGRTVARSEEHTSELQSLMRISYAVSCLKKKTPKQQTI